MRYRVKVVELTDSNGDSTKKKRKTLTYVNGDENMSENSSILNDLDKYLIQNWQFEIRKLTYEDAGTYTCLLPLVKPITKNITLQVIREFNFFLFTSKLRSLFIQAKINMSNKIFFQFFLF